MTSKPYSDQFRLVPEKIAAEVLGVSISTLQQWRWRGGGPPFCKLTDNGAVRYDLDALKAWVSERTRKSTSQE